MHPHPAGLKKSLKLWHVVIMGLAYLTPMAVFDTFGIVTEITEGHVPTAYLLALIGIVLVTLQLRRSRRPHRDRQRLRLSVGPKLDQDLQR